MANINFTMTSVDDKQMTSQAAKTSRPAIYRKLMLNSEQAQKVFRRYFQQVDHHSFSISVISRAHGHFVQAEAVEIGVRECIKKMQSQVLQSMQTVEQLSQDLGIDNQGLVTRPQSYVACISNSMSLEYLGLLIQVDHYLCRYETLVILGQYSYSDRQHETYEWQRQLIRLAKRIRTESHGLRHYHRARSTTV